MLNSTSASQHEPTVQYIAEVEDKHLTRNFRSTAEDTQLISNKQTTHGDMDGSVQSSTWYGNNHIYNKEATTHQ